MKKTLFTLALLFVGVAAVAQCTAAFTAPYTESFDVTGTPSCWSQYDLTGGPWAFSQGSGVNTACGTPSEHTGNSGYFAWMDQSSSDDSVCLEMHDVDVSTLTTPYLQFYFSECGSNVTTPNFLYIEAWDGSAWANVGTINQATSGWQFFGFDISSNTFGTNLVRIRFRAESGGDPNDYNADPLLDDISILEAPSCQQPSALSATNVTATSADLNWSANNGETSWDIEWGTAGFTPGTGTLVSNTSSNPYLLSGLLSVTAYEFYVRGICGASDTSSWAGPFGFSTPCGNYLPNYLEDFTTYTPVCWEEAAGVLGAVNTTFSSTTSSLWTSDGFANNGSSGSARMEIYSTGRDEWLISPTIDLGSGATPYQLQFDVALTTWNNTNADVLGADDTLAIVISTDNGVTWSNTNILQLYTAGSEPSATGDFTIIPLTGYTGLVKFGLYAASSVSGGDVNVYIDNFEVRNVPNCPQPVGVVVDSTSTSKAYLSWTLGATNSVVEYGPVGFTLGSGTTVPLANAVDSLTGLMSSTTYEFYIKDSCNTVDVSPWTGPLTFTTDCAPFMAPYSESFDISGTPTCWSQYDLNGGPWAFSQGSGVNTACGTPSEHTGNGGYFAWMDQSSTDDSVCLEMYDVDVSALTTAYLEFYYSECGSGVSAQNFLYVEAWDGTMWTNVGTINQSTNGWAYFGFDISGHTYGANLVKIRFRAESGGDGNDYNADNLIDDISILEAPTCFQPSNLNATNVTSNSADLGWTANTGETEWAIEWGTAGFTQGTGTTVSSTATNPYALSGLSSITAYDFYVRGVCGVGDSSTWAGPFSFTTLCGIYSPTYTEDFTTYIPTCWEEFQGVLGANGTVVTNATTSNWNSEDFGNTGSDNSAYINLYSTGRDEWLVSPSIDLGAGTTDYLLSFDVAVTDYNNTSVGPLGVDDTVAVVISNDNGMTWTSGDILQMWGQGTEPSNTGDYVGINLSGYTGVVKVGFYAASSASNADNDIFVDNFSVSPCVHSANAVSLTVCDSYTTASGTVYTADGTFNDTLVNAIGCDSVLTVTLTVINSTAGTDVQAACDTYTWIDGNTYTASNNSATFVLTNAVGCDSTVTLDLTITNSTTGTDVQTACDTYTWIDGNAYTASNNSATFVLTNAVGCDSTVTLDLTINNSDATTDFQTGCDSFTWIDGNTYTASNNAATHTLTNMNGCDSVVTLNLTMYNSTSATATHIACGSYTWIDGVTYTATNNTAMYTIPNSNGCDSVITLDLTINDAVTNTITATECESYTSAAGNTYTSTGMYMETFTGANGCDSILTLDLTITNPNSTVSLSNNIFLTSNQPGATYQWLDCGNGNAPITGATNQVYVATANGDYACEVTFQNCTVTSTCITVSTVGLDDESATFANVFPNPVSTILTVTLSDKDAAQYELLDMQGKVVMSSTSVVSGQTIDVSILESGVYFVRLTSDDQTMIKRVVKN